MEFIGSAENVAGTGAFLDKVAEENDLELQAQLVDRDDILQQRVLHTGHNLSVQPMSRPDDHPTFETIFDVEL